MHVSTMVFLTRSKNGEFNKLCISRNPSNIELNGVNFWRLCFFEVIAVEIIFRLSESHDIIFPFFLQDNHLPVGKLNFRKKEKLNENKIW